MIIFERLNINQRFKNQEQNMQELKAWADNLVDDLTLMAAQLDDAQSQIKKLESEGK